MVGAGTDSPGAAVALQPEAAIIAETEAAVKEFVQRVSRLPFVRAVAIARRWGAPTMWAVVDSWSTERTKAILGVQVDLHIALPQSQFDCRILDAERAGDDGVAQALAAPNMTLLWVRPDAPVGAP